MQINGSAALDLAGHGLVSVTKADGTSEDYELQYIQFKSPSEHCFDFKRYEVEMQMYLAKPGETEIAAAIAVFWDQSVNNEDKGLTSCNFIQALHADQAFKSEKTMVFDLKLKSRLGGYDFRTFYSYEGSLTNPPCTEGI